MRQLVLRFTMVTALAIGLAGASASSANAEGISGPDALTLLKSFAGGWTGNAMTPDGAPVSVTYEVTSGGSVVLEKLFAGSDHEMVTMYHLEDDQLVATHYCSMGNQPTMKLDTKASDSHQLVFQFEKVTGLKKPDEMHIHHGTIRIVDADRLEASWGMNSKDAQDKKLFLSRAKA